MVAVVVFDVGGVLTNHISRELHEWVVAETGADPEHVMEMYSRWWEFLDIDLCSASEYYMHLEEHFDLPIPASRIEERYAEMLSPIEESWDIVRELSGSVELAVLSDMSEEHMRLRKSRMPFDEHFGVMVWSCEVGATKPSRVMFETLLERLDREPEECLFVDDVEQLVEAARVLGMQAVRFENPQQLRGELASRGVL